MSLVGQDHIFKSSWKSHSHLWSTKLATWFDLFY